MSFWPTRYDLATNSDLQRRAIFEQFNVPHADLLPAEHHGPSIPAGALPGRQ